MRQREQRLWDAMRRHVPGTLWLQRIENAVGEGMPDVYVGRSGRWVELKAAARIPVRPTTPLLGKDGLRQSQINWHMRAAAWPDAPITYILVGTPDHEVYLLPGHNAKRINSFTLAEVQEASCARNWPSIVEELLG